MPSNHNKKVKKKKKKSEQRLLHLIIRDGADAGEFDAFCRKKRTLLAWSLLVFCRQKLAERGGGR